MMPSAQTHETSWPTPLAQTLENGLQLIIVEDERSAKVTCQLHIYGAGGYYDPPGWSGLATLAASVARERVVNACDGPTRAGCDELGIDMRVKATCNGAVTTFECTAAADQLSLVVRLVANLALERAVSPNETGDVLEVMRTFRERQWGVPQFVVEELLASAMFGAHPGARLRVPIATLASYTAEQLAAFARERYVPNRSLVAIVGNVSRTAAYTAAVRAFDDWTMGGHAPLGTERAPEPRRGAHVVSAASDGVHVRLSTVVGVRADRETDVVDVICRTLHDDDGRARLNRTSRIGDDGRARRFVSGLSPHKFGGVWSVHSDLAVSEIDTCIPLLFDEVARLCIDDVDEKDLRSAQRRVIDDYSQAFAQPRHKAGAYVFAHENGLGPEYWSGLPERIMSITAREVREVAQKYLAPDRLVAAAVGPREPLERVFRALDFPVTVWHRDGFALRWEADDASERRGSSS